MESRMRAIAAWISASVTALPAAWADFDVMRTGLDMRSASDKSLHRNAYSETYADTRSRRPLDFEGGGCKRVTYLSIAAAALRPSEIAHTTSDCPRRISPAAKT